jgi:hypothetical protein
VHGLLKAARDAAGGTDHHLRACRFGLRPR